MTPKKPKESTVDYIRRGREFRRFIDAHCTKDKTHGFNDKDMYWIREYCPESGADVNERKYDKEWVRNARSLSSTRYHWRKHMKTLDENKGAAEVPRYAQQTAASSRRQVKAASDQMPGRFPVNEPELLGLQEEEKPTLFDIIPYSKVFGT